MKFLYFHLIYCTIIAFLGYNYWSSVQAFQAFGHVNQQLNVDYLVMDNSSTLPYNAIKKICLAYPNTANNEILNQAKSVVNFATSSIDFIKVNKSVLHLDPINLLNYECNSPNNSFFNEAKIVEIKNNLIEFRKNLINMTPNEVDQKTIDNLLLTTKTINSTSYWKTLKYLPLTGILTELSFLENQIKCDEITLLNYFNKKFSVSELDDSDFKTAIAPKKAVLINGEIFEAEIYLAKYASYTGNNVRFIVNGQPLDAQDGIVHFMGQSETVGTKIIKAEAIVTNPLTGFTKTTTGYFEYQVLPKCSRDCQ
jgi:hypothetical protein